MSKRKIIQIAVADEATIALCDDGSLWSLVGREFDSRTNSFSNIHWHRMLPIPQDDDDEDQATEAA
jgi:hypothetical protein